MLDSRSLTAYPGEEQEDDIDSVLANYDVDQVARRDHTDFSRSASKWFGYSFQISSMKMIESSKKKIAPEIHLMTKQKELICLVGVAFIRMSNFKFRPFLFLHREEKTWRR